MDVSLKLNSEVGMCDSAAKSVGRLSNLAVRRTFQFGNQKVAQPEGKSICATQLALLDT
jgi:hypothetical protein